MDSRVTKKIGETNGYAGVVFFSPSSSSSDYFYIGVLENGHDGRASCEWEAGVELPVMSGKGSLEAVSVFLSLSFHIPSHTGPKYCVQTRFDYLYMTRRTLTHCLCT